MYAFKVPDVGEGVVEAEVLEWRVAEGDWVKEDQNLVDLLTDKAEIEIPSPVEGRVHRLHAQPGEIVAVGSVLIEIDDESPAQVEPTDEPTAPPRPAAERPARTDRPTAAQPPTAPERPAAAREMATHPPAQPQRPRLQMRGAELPSAAAQVQAVPAVRALAERLGIDLRAVRGTGPGGRIMRRDIERQASGEVESEPVAAVVADEEDWERRPLRGLRRVIARRMVHARRTAAHFTYVDEVDMTRLLERSEATWGAARPSPLAFIANAVARSLPGHEMLNASIDDASDEIIVKRRVHLGIAAATQEGLIVPVIRDAAQLSVIELSKTIESLGERARAGALTPAELRGGTFTISSLGKLGGIISTPIVNHPEVAILGVNAIRPVPSLVDGQLSERRMMNLSISVDHRIADGLVAAEFIRDVRVILEAADFPELSAQERSP
jgi:pyruvate/2-oxoglutarate dehydrogenase complex dihydrolipoamide acyltransferase (E2) component